MTVTCTDGYQYTEDLLALDHCRPQPGREPVQERLAGVCSPLVVNHLEEMFISLSICAVVGDQGRFFVSIRVS